MTELRTIPPTHPGEMLREDFMPDYGLTTSALAAALGVSRQSVHELLREERTITPLMALRLSRLFGNSAAFWLNAQQTRDLWESRTAQSQRIDTDSTVAHSNEPGASNARAWISHARKRGA
ncbi:MAG: HigA family addiction module antitoxin [Anaerolineae bacterium]